MKKILVLGAGLVAKPLVRYLLEQPDFHVTIASRTVRKAQDLIQNHPKGLAKELNVENTASLKTEISQNDIVISLLPWTRHLTVAKLCLELGKNMVTTSYVKPEMQALDEQVRKKGLLFLNEIGVDPGIDHMAAMSIIDNVKANEGKILSFFSYCGGLPALQSNTNPFGYKFSWSPEGVMLAATNNGRYQKDGHIIDVPGEALFEHYWLLDVPNAGTFEAYVNRDALPYKKLYKIEDTLSIYRGTLRNIGHCESWNYFKKIGLLNQERVFDFSEVSPREVIAKLISSTSNDVEKDMSLFLNVPEHSISIKKLKWLGLFCNKKIDLGKASAFDMFAWFLKQKLVYAPGEVDLLVQHHEFIADYDTRRERITSTMVDLGIPGGDSSMARTVSLPAAIATKLILTGKIKLTGVHIPVLSEFYKPVLAELETMNIKLVEHKTDI